MSKEQEIRNLIDWYTELDESEFEKLGRYDLAFGVAKILDEPTTLRPMSELPEEGENKQVLFKLYHKEEDVSTWATGWQDGSELIRVGGILHREKDGYRAINVGSKLLGWLPLPNPNDIKLK